MGNFLSVSGIFYGITLGLITIGSFENFQAHEIIVSEESSIISSLYRNVSVPGGPDMIEMKATLKEYTVYTAAKAGSCSNKPSSQKARVKL